MKINNYMKIKTYTNGFFEKIPIVISNLPEYITEQNLQNYLLANYGEKYCTLLDNAGIINSRIECVYYNYKYYLETLINTTTQQYNPIENYNMVENSNSSAHGTSSLSNTNTIKNTTYDSDVLRDTNQDIATGSGENSATSENHITRTGNIGVTTTQQMLAQERKIADMRIIDEIINIFLKHFTLGVFDIC